MAYRAFALPAILLTPLTSLDDVDVTRSNLGDVVELLRLGNHTEFLHTHFDWLVGSEAADTETKSTILRITVCTPFFTTGIQISLNAWKWASVHVVKFAIPSPKVLFLSVVVVLAVS